MTTAAEFVAAAAREVGYTERPTGSNRTKFAAIAGHPNGQPWCASFVVAIARRVGLQLPSESAYTPTMAAGFKNVGRWVTPKNIEPGDVVFYDFPDSKRRIQHVGIAAARPAAGFIDCIEGNTSAGSSGSQDNGGGVYRRRRPLAHVVGAGRPAFAAAPPPPPRPKEPPVIVWRDKNDRRVFVSDGNTKRHIPDMVTLRALFQAAGVPFREPYESDELTTLFPDA